MEQRFMGNPEDEMDSIGRHGIVTGGTRTFNA